jgi:hypothetical protein
MVVVGELQSLARDVVGDIAHALAELFPVARAQARRALERHGPIVVHRVAGLGEHEHGRAHRLQKVQVILKRSDLGFRALNKQISAIPAADDIDAERRNRRLQRIRFTWKLAAELYALKADFLGFAQDGLQRRVAAKFRHVVIGPSDGADAEANAHVLRPFGAILSS